MAAINKHTDGFFHYADKRERRVAVIYLYYVRALRMLLKLGCH